MQEKHTKIIWLSILFTMLALITLCGVIFAILYFGMPKDLADFTYSLGNERFASHLYYKAYKKNNDIDLCYKALNLKIKIKDNKGIVEIYEAYLQDEEYDDYNELMKIHKDYVDCSIIERSVILNDENYLENKYISALINLNKSDMAFNRAVSNFSKYKEFNFEYQGVYNFNLFITNHDLFKVSYDGYNLTLIDAMQDYFDKALNLFNEKKSTEDDLEQSYLIALGNRLILVGQNINSVYSSSSDKADIISENVNNLQDINDIIKGLLNS